MIKRKRSQFFNLNNLKRHLQHGLKIPPRIAQIFIAAFTVPPDKNIVFILIESVKLFKQGMNPVGRAGIEKFQFHVKYSTVCRALAVIIHILKKRAKKARGILGD